jgi:hypothetical protein
VKNVKLFLAFFLILGVSTPGLADDDSVFSSTDFSQGNKWVASSPVDESDRLIKFTLQADYQQDANIQGQAFSVLDISAKRLLDENAVTADALLRIEKNLSTSDEVTDFQLRLARLSYLQPWLQVSVGRFDLFQTLTPNLFFGGYPIMGIHRVDGVMMTLPFSFFFNVGESKVVETHNSSPLALTFFYTPSLFSAEEVQYNSTQAYWLSQLRCRINTNDFETTFRGNIGGTQTNFFSDSSFNGNLTYSIAADLAYQQNYDLTAEFGSQNASSPSETGVLSLGFQMSRIGTWGDFSIDQIALESQFPLEHSLDNPFTGGNNFNPYLAQTPQNSWYAKIRARLRVLFIEFHVTNNQDDFTFGRLVPGSVAVPFTGAFGPGNETDGPGISLRSASYSQLAYFVRTGVEF